MFLLSWNRTSVLGTYWRRMKLTFTTLGPILKTYNDMHDLTQIHVMTSKQDPDVGRMVLTIADKSGYPRVSLMADITSYDLRIIGDKIGDAIAGGTEESVDDLFDAYCWDVLRIFGESVDDPRTESEDLPWSN